MATIGSLNVNLGMNTAKFSAGAKAVKSTLGSMIPSFGGLGTAVAGLGAALGAGALAAGFKSMVSSAMESIDATAKVSDRLGITTESLIGLRHAANLSGVGMEEFDGSLEKMTKNLGNAAAKGGPTADALKRIGLDAKTLAAQSPDEAFKSIAEGISQIENPTERARAATDIFGKSGQKLLNTLMAGRAEIEAQAAETEKFGTAISRVDAAKVEAANDAMTRAGEVVKGLAAQVAVQLAPFIEVAANKFIELATAGGGMGSTVSAAFEVVAKSVAFVADMWDVLVIGFKGAQYLISKGIAFLVQGIAKLGDGVVWLANQFGADIDNTFLNSLADGLNETADQIGKEIEETLIGPSSGEKVTAFFADVRAGAQEAAEAVAKATQEQSKFSDSIEATGDDVAKLVSKLQEQVALFGLEGRAADIAKLKLAGFTDEQLAEARALSDQLTKLDEDAKSKASLKSIEDSALTNKQKLERELASIGEAFTLGMISESEMKLHELVAQREFGAEEAAGNSRPAALEFGTAAAFSASFGSDAKDDRLVKLNAQILAQLKLIKEQDSTQSI